MRALSRILVTGLVLVTLVWLKGQFDQLRRAVLELNRLSESGGIWSSHDHEGASAAGKTTSNSSSSEVEDPFRAVFHALSNSLISETIEDLATQRSAFRDQRSKTLVVAKTVEENTKWIDLLLPNWGRAVYSVDDRKAPFHTARNKGREANAYLTYIIENYDDLPDTVAFVHSHISSWHNEQNAARALQLLNVDFVQRSGYANFRCSHDPGCPAEIHPFRQGHFEQDGRESKTELAFAGAWMQLFNVTEVPQEIGVACCAQFAVSKSQIRKRSREEYVWFHNWLMDTPLDDDVSGRIFEYSWHVIFGRDPVYCPSLHECYRDVYDQFDIS